MEILRAPSPIARRVTAVSTIRPTLAGASSARRQWVAPSSAVNTLRLNSPIYAKEMP